MKSSFKSQAILYILCTVPTMSFEWHGLRTLETEGNKTWDDNATSVFAENATFNAYAKEKTDANGKSNKPKPSGKSDKPKPSGKSNTPKPSDESETDSKSSKKSKTTLPKSTKRSCACDAVTEVCSIIDGAYTCVCAEGYENVTGICTVVLEDQCNASSIVPQDDFYDTNQTFFSVKHQVLLNDVGDQLVLDSIVENGIFGNCSIDGQSITYTRNYDNGYHLGEDSCVYQCCDASGCCGTASFLVNTSCSKGYENVDGVCRDIDECSEGLDDCDAGDTCVNTDGHFVCMDSVVQDIVSAGVSESTITLFHREIFNAMANDSPLGFVSGDTTFAHEPLQFESSLNFEAVDSMFVLEGTFVPLSEEGIPEGTYARVYSPSGLQATALVDTSGHYSMIMTDISPGRTPFILTFSSLSSSGTPGRRHLVGESQCPKSFWIFGSLSCSNSFTFQLRWDQPTSDVDLRVYEPDGTIVYYSDKVGNYGSLDVDDTNGFGPEHYTAPVVAPGDVYTAKVQLYSVKSDTVPLNYTLKAYQGSTVLLLHQGSLDYNKMWSQEFTITIPESSNTCDRCSIGSTSHSVLERHLAVENKESTPPCCPVKKWSGLCSDYNPFCDDEDVTWSWKVYTLMDNWDATESNLRAFINLLIVPLLSSDDAKKMYGTIMDGLKNGQGDLECLKYQILAAYCKINFGKTMEFWLKKVYHFLTKNIINWYDDIDLILNSLEWVTGDDMDIEMLQKISSFDEDMIPFTKHITSRIGCGFTMFENQDYRLDETLKGPRCPPGLEVSQSECLAAGKEVSPINADQSWLITGSWDYTPCGCFLWRSSSSGNVNINFDQGNGECKESASTVGMICKSPYAMNLIDSVYTFGAPAVVKDPPMSNPGNKCIPGIRAYTENVIDGEVVNRDFAASINHQFDYPHAKTSTLLLRDADEEITSEFFECQDSDDMETPYDYQILPKLKLPVSYSRIGRIHSIRPSYEPRLMKTEKSIRGPLLEYASAALCVYSITNEDDSISADNAAECLSTYPDWVWEDDNGGNKLPGMGPSWNIEAWMNHEDGWFGWDPDTVYVLVNDDDPSFRRCILSFSGSKSVFGDFSKFDDLLLKLRHPLYRTDGTFCGRGGIHKGVRNELRNIINDDQYQNRIKTALETCHEVSCVGHSLGGSLCNLLTMCVNQGLEFLDVTSGKEMWKDYSDLAWNRPQHSFQ